MSEPGAGDTVRVSFDSEVNRDYGNTWIDIPGVGAWPLGAIDDRFTIEIIRRATPPEPTEPGTVVRVSLPDGNVDVFERGPGCRWLAVGSTVLCDWASAVSGADNVQVIFTPGGGVGPDEVAQVVVKTEADYIELPVGSMATR